jgi:hypothetical protein
MASLEQHKRDCLRWLDSDFEPVHNWLDELFATHGAQHRQFRHHLEGIEQAEQIFGPPARAAAIVHILRDCRNIPRKSDYVDGIVDALGLPKAWPATAYVHFTEEAFSSLVKFQLQGPTGVVLWAFIGNEIAMLLGSTTKLSPEEINQTLPKWQIASKRKDELAPLLPPDSLRPIENAAARTYVDGLKEKPLYVQLMAQFGSYEFASAPIESLATCLALIDFEYLEELRAELQGEDDASLVRFALPDAIQQTVRAGLDNRSAIFVSQQKTLTVSAPIIQPILGGAVEVKFLVSPAASIVIVSRVGGRLYLRSGIHRAYLLASMGRKEIPAVFVRENQVPALSGAYPAFSPASLSQARPPLLKDYFDESLSLKVPLQRSHKVVRVTAEEFVIPVD